MLRLTGGVNTTETPALNENGGISSSNLIRYFFDQNGPGLVGKLGGWSKFYPYVMASVVRALWAWEDVNDNSHLAFGTQQVPAQTYSQLGVITAGALTDVTPTARYDNYNAPSASATIGSATITVSSSTELGVQQGCSVYIATQIAVGGVVLFGFYQCNQDGYFNSANYHVLARDQLGNLVAATTVAGASLPVFTTVIGSSVVTVTLTNHGYALGTTFPVLMATSVNGILLQGNYVVQSISSANSFTIAASGKASSTGSVTLNNGLAVFIFDTGAIFGPSGGKVLAADWTLDNFGQDLIACPTTSISGIAGLQVQPLYLWDPTGQPYGQVAAAVIPQAPPINDGAFVAMPQRQIVAWGSTQTGIQDPLLVAWCDVNNPSQWIPLTTNQAGSYRIPKGSRIVGCIQGPQQAIIWTDIDVWSMQYIGPPLVYSFNEIGAGCGLIGRKAAASLNGIVYWMGQAQFYTLGSAGVVPLPCPVWDVVFQNLWQGSLLVPFQTAMNRIRVAVNSRFGEIQWFYPSANGAGEVDSYVKYNVLLGEWDYGSLGRSAWVDQSVLGPPIGADPSSLYLYQHETSNDADGVAMQPFLQTGYFALAEGDFKTFVDLVWPDMKWGQYSAAQTAAVQITFYVVDYPGDTPTADGPYTVTKATEYFNTRLRGRLVAIRISSSDLGTWWRIGALRYRYAPDGKF